MKTIANNFLGITLSIFLFSPVYGQTIFTPTHCSCTVTDAAGNVTCTSNGPCPCGCKGIIETHTEDHFTSTTYSITFLDPPKFKFGTKIVTVGSNYQLHVDEEILHANGLSSIRPVPGKYDFDYNKGKYGTLTFKIISTPFKGEIKKITY